MANGLEMIRDAINEFTGIQKYMLAAKEEGASKTYALLKERYLALKAMLNVAGVNLTDIDTIKE